MKLQKLYRSPPNSRHLLWALPLGVLICAAMWWFEVGLFNFSGLSRGSRPEIEYFYAVSLQNYIVSALVGSISILVANWSRTLWPRLAVTVVLLAVQLITGSMFILSPCAA